jgi:hypothetical protein
MPFILHWFTNGKFLPQLLVSSTMIMGYMKLNKSLLVPIKWRDGDEIVETNDKGRVHLFFYQFCNYHDRRFIVFPF